VTQSAINVVPSEMLVRLSEAGELRTYAAKELIVNEGDVSDALFILVAGQLKVFSRDIDNRQVVHNVLHAGEIFGEMFLDGGVRSASVKAIMPSQCIQIDDCAIHSLIRDVPEFADYLIRILIARLRHATDMIKGFAFNDVYERTSKLLNQLAETNGVVRFVSAQITQQEIADRVGATREMVNHVLKALLKGGFVEKDESRRLILVKKLPPRW
jgi:CRP/FNR family cyclic AMP-dependent transcriptional regulator